MDDEELAQMHGMRNTSIYERNVIATTYSTYLLINARRKASSAAGLMKVVMMSS